MCSFVLEILLHCCNVDFLCRSFLPKPNKLLFFFFWNTRKKTHCFKQITYWSLLFDTFLYFEKGRGSCLRCVACGAVITVKHTLIEYADLLEIKKKYFRREISVFTLSERDSGSNFWFLARNWCVLENVRSVKIMLVWNVFKSCVKFLCGTFYNLFNE